ncbi:thioredoxin domain-containing protein 11-like [Ptychodera flava]|uniref:thioredoxin domain-containing protein 11-like n=1 Tax=Ptychodera flava TaxID=63121 RepID=UPI00396A92F0
MQNLHQNRSRLLRVMAQHPELCIVIVSSVFMFFTNTISYSNAGYYGAEPKAIFAEHSPVKEYKYGNMQAVKTFLQNSTSEVYFILYYAPWDGTSLEAAAEYEAAAYDLYGEVTFLAVNCWWPRGSCRKNVPLRFYPMLMAYNDRFEGVQYRGIIKAKYMIDFLKKICSPLIYVPDDEELGKFVAQRDSSLIGHFDMSGSVDISGYDIYYQAALFSLEKDPNNPLQFGVISSHALANAHGILMPKTVVLTRMMNKTLVYPRSANFTSREIVEWAYKHREELLPWLVPSGMKSISMSAQVSKKPFVLLLSSHSGSDKFNSHFQQLREVAMDYYNCNKSGKIDTTVEILRAIRDKEKKIQELKEQTNFHSLSLPSPPSSSSFSSSSSSSSSSISSLSSSVHQKVKTRNQSCCTSLLNENSGNCMSASKSYDICDVCLESITRPGLLHKWCPSNVMDFMWSSAVTFTSDFLSSLNSCVNFHCDYNPSFHFSLCCNHSYIHTCNYGNRYSVFPAMNSTYQDGFQVISDSVNQAAIFHLDVIPFNKVVSPTYHVQESASFQKLKSSFAFTGLACNTNKSLNFFAMNSDVYGVYTDRLGIQLGLNEAALAIIDIKNEAEYILQVPFSRVHMQSFITSYTMNELPRQLRTSNVHQRCPNCGDVSVTEVTTDNFNDIVLDVEKDVVLLYYAPWCGFCLRIHPVYLSLAQVFKSAKHLTVARLNADINDLPWEFTVVSYPAILFYPAGHKSWSGAFPIDQDISLESLSIYVLEHAVQPIDL